MKTFTAEEVRSLIYQALLKVDTLVYTSGQRDGFVELNEEELNNFLNENGIHQEIEPPTPEQNEEF
jgi:hypothetical protein